MARDRDWLLPCAVLLCAEWLAGGVIALRTGYSELPPIFGSASIAFILAGLGICYLVFSARLPLAMAYDQRRSRIAVLLAGCGLLALQFALLTWCKYMMDATSDFWAGPLLADFDHAIFGVDPWRLAHKLPTSLLIGLLYWAWIPLTSFIILCVILREPSDQKSRAILSFFCVFAFGAFFQFALPSAGPLFYDLAGHGSRYVAMLSEVPGNALVARKLLWQAHVSRTIVAGFGVSAMPSMHVAEAAWTALVARTFWRRAAWLAVAFYLAMLFGSVYMGLHFFADGIAGTIGAVSIWFALSDAFIRRMSAVGDSVSAERLGRRRLCRASPPD